MKETKTVQVYPSDSIVNATISEYESFGWEVVGNQRCQEYEGQTRDIFDGSTTNHYSTFNKITFTREKDNAWYAEVSAAEKEYEKIKNEIRSCKNREPSLKKLQPEGFIGIMLGIFLWCFWIIPGIIWTIVRSSQKSKYKKQYERELAEYNSVYPAKIEELERKQGDLRLHAEKCIAGKV